MFISIYYCTAHAWIYPASIILEQKWCLPTTRVLISAKLFEAVVHVGGWRDLICVKLLFTLIGILLLCLRVVGGVAIV